LAFSWPGFAMVIAGLGVIGVVAAGFSIDPKRAASGVYREGFARIGPEAKILFHADGKTATVTVVESGGLRTLRTNGKTDASMTLDGTAMTRGDEPTQALLGALPVAAHPKAKRAAVIGIGSGITSTALLAAPSLERLDTIEIEPRMVDGAKFFSERNAALFSDPRSHFVVDDAKSWLARATEPYDIIVSEPSNPWVSGVASLFTIETYERIAKHLARGGVLVQWIQMYEIDEALLSSIFRAMVAHFPHYVVHVVGTTDLIVVASKEQRPRVEASTLFNLPGMAKLLRQSGFASPAAIDATWRGDNTTVDVLMSAFDAPVNSDYRPYVDVHAARARFVRASVDRLFGAPVAPSMLDLLGGQRAPGDGDDVLAVALGEALVAAPEGSVALPDAHKAYADALRASRELLRTCKPGGLPAVLLEGAIGTAMVINDQRDLGRAQNVWAVVRKGDCYRSLPPELKDWVNLFAAVASRDAPAMADLGSRLVASAPHEFARDYALNAAVVGEIAQGRAEFGGRLLELHAGDRDSVWLTTLRQATSKRTIARR
ncbi:MAG TPA: hypothetical protein VNE58_11595, partial [Casimicrobiaceae bacterium]|nr:hypothetical protein [Casimicrobiaceae bacterium]